MAKKLVLGSIAGTVILFAWSFVSWMALGLHHDSYSAFTDEGAVLKAIGAQAPASGIYLVPNVHATVAAAPADKKKDVEAACMEKLKAGPSGMVVVHKDGMDMKTEMPKMMGRGLVIGAVASLVVTWILLQLGAASFGKRVLVAVLAGAGGAVITNLNYWNWWGFPDTYTCVESADTAFAWLLTGLVLAKITGGKGRKR